MATEENTTQKPRSSKMNRRGFLSGMGGAALVLVAGGGVYRAADRGVFSTGRGAAYEPWDAWRTDKASGPLALVQSAILAANPHNSQPWLFRLSDEQVDIFADTRRTIGTIDPYYREMTIGLGCAVENAVLTAQAVGYNPQVTLMPDPTDTTHVAHVALPAGTNTPSALFHAIPERHTNRAAYDAERPVSPETLAAITALNQDPDISVLWFTSAGERQRVGELIVAATEALIADAQQLHDSDAWLRLGWDQLQTHRDGITVDAQGGTLLSRALLKVLPNTTLGDSEQGAKVFLQTTRNVHVATAAAFGLLVARDAASNAQRLGAGRFWQRTHLWATTQGLAVQPLNQMAERADRERQTGLEPTFGNALTELAGNSGWQALMPFRIGYPTQEALPSPRRNVEDVLV